MKLLVLDGNSILNRAFYGIKLLTTKAGDFTNGIYGFLTMLKKLLDETAPGGVAIAFDRKAPTFRHKAYAGYKANRKGMPEELAQQLPVLQELLTDLATALSPARGGRPTTSWAPWPPPASGRAANASSPPATGTACSWCLTPPRCGWPPPSSASPRSPSTMWRRSKRSTASLPAR